MSDREFEKQLQAMLQRNTVHSPNQEPIDAQIVETIPQEPVSAEKEVILYQTDDGNINVSVFFYDETFWLTQKAMADLFGVDRTVITKHLSNIFSDEELDKNSVCAIFAHTASDGKKYRTQYYNLVQLHSNINSSKHNISFAVNHHKFFYTLRSIINTLKHFFSFPTPAACLP